MATIKSRVQAASKKAGVTGTKTSGTYKGKSNVPVKKAVPGGPNYGKGS